jgi:hypothetical protein
MGWAIRGHRKVEDRGVPPLKFPRQDVGAFLECGQPWSFFCLKQFIKGEGLMSYKQAFVVEHSVARLLSEARTLFLIGETRKSVRFLMRQSSCTPNK